MCIHRTLATLLRVLRFPCFCNSAMPLHAQHMPHPMVVFVPHLFHVPLDLSCLTALVGRLPRYLLTALPMLSIIHCRRLPASAFDCCFRLATCASVHSILARCSGRSIRYLADCHRPRIAVGNRPLCNRGDAGRYALTSGVQLSLGHFCCSWSSKQGSGASRSWTARIPIGRRRHLWCPVVASFWCRSTASRA